MAGKTPRRVKRVLKLLAFALVVHVFVLPQIGGAHKALSVLGSVNPLLVALAVALETGAFLAYARLTQLLIPAEHRPSLRLTFGAVNYRLLGHAGVPANEVSFALGTQAIGSAVVLNVILWLALVVSIPRTGFQPIYATVAAIGAVLIALGHRPGVVGLLVAYGLANVMAVIPISPGGLGVIEAVLIPTLVGFGTPRAQAAVGVVAYRLVNFWLPIPVGAVSYVAVERATSAERRRGFGRQLEEQIDRVIGDV